MLCSSAAHSFARSFISSLITGHHHSSLLITTHHYSLPLTTTQYLQVAALGWAVLLVQWIAGSTAYFATAAQPGGTVPFLSQLTAVADTGPPPSAFGRALTTWPS